MTSVQTAPAEQADGFARFNLGPAIQRGLKRAGFTEPRPIQAATIAAALEGKDVLGLAPTGTGKTAAFTLPILERLMSAGPHGPRRIRALILAPTRELARQIDEEIKVLAKFTGIRSATVYGGVSMGMQIRSIQQNPQIVVACPGRLLDLHDRNAINLSGVETVVLDETDYMLDLGFLPGIRRIMSLLVPQRQNLMFSATMPKDIRQLANSILRDPLVIELNTKKPAETIDHAIYPVLEEQKFEMLQHLLDGDEFESAIVFTRTKYRAQRIAKRLTRDGHRAVALEGNMTQRQRDRAMEGFREGKYDTLVATDVASRGIDVASVSHVVNFDIPKCPDSYTHRIGRTGRSERQGQAITLVTGDDGVAIRDIERQLGEPLKVVQLRGFQMPTIKTKSSGGKKSSGRKSSNRRPQRSNGGGSGQRTSNARSSEGRPGNGRPSNRLEGSEGNSGNRRSKRQGNSKNRRRRAPETV